MITEINKDNIEKFLDKEITIRLSPSFVHLILSHFKIYIRNEQISDEEIFQNSIKEMEERYGSGCDEEIDAHFRGGIWYREQSKKSKQYYRGIQI